MNSRVELLCQQLKDAFGDRIGEPTVSFGAVSVVIQSQHYLDVARALKDDPQFSFEQLIDLSGIDYSAFHGWESGAGRRFAAVSQLLSISHNRRLQIKVFASDDGAPVLPSVIGIWSSVDWYEREAYDLYGIRFEGHGDLRRILTDYGFVGHPFRKDFPVSGHVEMRYDPVQRRVIYQPVTIEPRENVPRIVREENYGKVR